MRLSEALGCGRIQQDSDLKSLSRETQNSVFFIKIGYSSFLEITKMCLSFLKVSSPPQNEWEDHFCCGNATTAHLSHWSPNFPTSRGTHFKHILSHHTPTRYPHITAFLISVKIIHAAHFHHFSSRPTHPLRKVTPKIFHLLLFSRHISYALLVYALSHWRVHTYIHNPHCSLSKRLQQRGNELCFFDDSFYKCTIYLHCSCHCIESICDP